MLIYHFNNWDRHAPVVVDVSVAAISCNLLSRWKTWQQ